MAGFKTFTSAVLTAADVNGYLMAQANIQCTSGTRPGSPHEGMVIYETDTDRFATYSGSAWSYCDGVGGWHTYTPGIARYIGSVYQNNVTIGNGTLTGRYRYIGARTVIGHVTWSVGNTDSGYNSDGLWCIGLPAASNGTISVGQGELYDTSGNLSYPVGGVAFGPSSSYLLLTCYSANATYLVRQTVDWDATAVPFQLASGDALGIGFLYETAA